MQKWSKIVLALLLFICLLDMPYGYYQMVRLLGLVSFSALAYYSNNKAEIIIYISLALLFQPLFKISLGRELWNVVDIIVGVGLIFSSIREFRDERSSQCR